MLLSCLNNRERTTNPNSSLIGCPNVDISIRERQIPLWKVGKIRAAILPFLLLAQSRDEGYEKLATRSTRLLVLAVKRPLDRLEWRFDMTRLPLKEVEGVRCATNTSKSLLGCDKEERPCSFNPCRPQAHVACGGGSGARACVGGSCFSHFNRKQYSRWSSRSSERIYTFTNCRTELYL